MPFYNENPVPKGPTDLCFDTVLFTRDVFSVDQFLQEHRNKANLETMRDDLGIYLKVLRSAMIDLINKDYADFVNLSTNLIGLDKAINDIQLPLGQLREELLEVRQSLDGAAGDISSQLGFLRELRERKRSLRSLNRAQTSLKKLSHLLGSLDPDGSPEIHLLERIVAEYNQIQFHISRCKRDLSSSDYSVFESVGSSLLMYINRMFLTNVSSAKTGDMDTLIRVLSIYQSLDMLNVPERLYREKVVSGYLENVIREEALRARSGGLPALYQRLLTFLESDMRHPLQAALLSNRQAGSGKKCDFFLRSFWPEVEEKLETNLSSIFSPGDPDVFYQKYSETLKFLEDVVTRMGSPVAEFQGDPHFLRFMEKWDLPVYFQIRFLEIVKELESALEKEPWPADGPGGDWRLVATQAAWRCINKCWEDGVCLVQIAHKFWKLTLQIISRFSTWVKSFGKNPKNPRSKDVDFLVCLYSDIEGLILKLPEVKTAAADRLPILSKQTVRLLGDSLVESGRELEGRLEGLDGLIIGALTGDSLRTVRQVSDIPRLYRRTNREAPVRQCQYVDTLLGGPVRAFHSRSHSLHPRATFWLTSMFSSLTKQYYSSVSEVLDSVQKTEESLRRLKKARDRSAAPSSLLAAAPSGLSAAPNSDRRLEDDNKIRLQLLIDVKAYLKGIEGFGLHKGSIEKLNDLLLLVEATQKL